MSRKSKALSGATAIAAGPSGLRRLLGGCLVVVLLGGLALGALLGFAAWLARDSDREPVALPCPPDSVAVVYTPRVGTPDAVRTAVEKALHDAGRKTTEGGWGSEEKRDLIVSWTPGSGARRSTGSTPTKIVLGAVPTATQVTSLLGDRLAACEAPARTSMPAEAEKPAQDAHDGSTGISWPWSGGWTPVTGIGLAAALWWVAGPNLVRGGWRALMAAIWPLRLAWRRMQRAAYRRRLRRGWYPAEWPEPVAPGQRWHEEPEAMHDRRTPRQQVRETEPARGAALRGLIRAERIAGDGIGPARLWRWVYRVPQETPTVGAPEKEEVSS